MARNAARPRVGIVWPALAAALLLAAVGFGLISAQDTARQDLDRRFADRAATTAGLIDSLIVTTARAQSSDLAERFGEARPSARRLAAQVRRGRLAFARIVDRDGRVLARAGQAPPGTERRAREALRSFRGSGTPAYVLTRVLQAPGAGPVVEMHVPFAGTDGARLFVSGIPAVAFTELFDPTLAGAPNSERARARVVDPTGHVLGDSAGTRRPGAPHGDPAFGRRLARHAQGIATGRIGTSPLEVALASDPAQLYAPIDGHRKWLAWGALALAAAAFVIGLFLYARLLRSHATLRGMVRRLEYQAHHDSLTGLANRARFFELLERRLARARGDESGTCAAVFLDLDGFKLINDRYGHITGDRVLVAVAARLEDAVRPGDVAGRVGGDELAVLLSDVGDTAEAESVAERIVAALADPYDVDGRAILLTASAGVAMGEDGDVAEELMRLADAAMYRTKLAA